MNGVKKTCDVVRAGLCDLVMDRGRFGYTHLGVPVGGAADPGAFAEANSLVGNSPDAAALEITLAGPVLAFPDGATAALTGAPFVATRSSGHGIAFGKQLEFARGERLSIGSARAGCRCWLALRGGIALPPVMGSRSTFLPSRFGGFDGRALRTGDALPIGECFTTDKPRASPPAPRDRDASMPLRVIPGPQLGTFEAAGLAAFFTTPYRVSNAADRRGLRLHGAPIAYAHAPDPASQAVLPGAIQVPADGQPIILGWDGPVTGGYPVLAGLISFDLPRLAQLRPGDSVYFSTITVEAAKALINNDGA